MDDPGDGPGPDAREALERLLLDGPRRYTRLQVAELAGMAPERTQRLWRALGFPDAADDDPAFTDADVQALGVLSDADRLRLRRRRDRGLDRPGDGAVAVPAGRLADRHARRRPGPRRATPASAAGGRPDEAVEAARARCCRSCARSRTTCGAGTSRPTPTGCWPPTGHGDRRELAVGFADLVGYTSRSRGMGGRELGAMVEDFESIAAEVIARHHGRVVKTVGDGVLFTAAVRGRRRRDRAAAARGLGRRGAAAAAGGRRLRPVLTRLGDVYSPVVNLASRLTSLARPGHRAGRPRARPAAARTCRAYRVRPLRRVSVRGYDHLQPWLVRREDSRATGLRRGRLRRGGRRREDGYRSQAAGDCDFPVFSLLGPGIVVPLAVAWEACSRVRASAWPCRSRSCIRRLPEHLRAERWTDRCG